MKFYSSFILMALSGLSYGQSDTLDGDSAESKKDHSQLVIEACGGINFTGSKGDFAPAPQYSIGMVGLAPEGDHLGLYMNVGFMQRVRRSKLIEQDYWYPDTNGIIEDTFSYRTTEVFNGLYLSWGVQKGISLKNDWNLIMRLGLTHSGGSGKFSWKYIEKPDVEDTRHTIQGQGGYFQNEFNLGVGLSPGDTKQNWICMLQYSTTGKDDIWLFDQLSGYQALELRFVVFPDFSP